MRRSVSLIFALPLIVLFAATAVVYAQEPIQDTQNLSLKLITDKTVYLPGEMIAVRFVMTNESTAPFFLNTNLSVLDGNLKVFIASDSDSFKEYIGPGWGTRDSLPGAPIKLMPSQSFETEATILWNQKAEVSHLSELYRKPLEEQRIKTDYAFVKPGKYYLKATLHSARTGTTIDSAPLAITVENPQGPDLPVWKQLKEDPSYAFFIQTGGLLESPKGAKTAKVANELNRLVSNHPDSKYAQNIRRSLTKRQELIDTIDRDNQ